MTLPRYAVVLEQEKEVDDGAFFQALSQLDARDTNILKEFMDNYRDVQIKVLGVSECLRFHERLDTSTEFEEFSVDIWKEFYIQEDIIQVGVLEDRQPCEGLFIGASSGRVYVCAQADDFSQQKCVCVADNLHKLIWRGPNQPIEIKPTCMMDGCYGCFDPVVRSRLFNFRKL